MFVDFVEHGLTRYVFSKFEVASFAIVFETAATELLVVKVDVNNAVSELVECSGQFSSFVSENKAGSESNKAFKHCQFRLRLLRAHFVSTLLLVYG